MKDIMKVFESKEFGKVRTVVVDDEPWLVGKDVAVALGYERDTKAVQDHVDDDDKYLIDGKTQSQFGIELGQRGGWLINESGMYALVFGSKLPKAKEFKHWVTHEILPSIRKTGGYSLDIPKTLPEALRAYANEVEAHAETKKKLTTAKGKIKHDAPLVGFASHIACTADSISVGDFAKIIYKDGITLGRNKLFEWLRNNKLLMKDNTPYQQYIDNGVFTVKEGTFNTVYGDRPYTKTLITGRGQIYITERIKKENNVQ